MEPGETLIQAVQREVLEEAGLVFSPTRVVGIEGSSPGFVLCFCYLCDDVQSSFILIGFPCM